MASKNWQASIQGLADANASAVNVSDLWPAEVEQMSFNGQLHSLPYDFSNNAIYYNKTMFEKEGIPAPTGDWTWEQFWQTAAAFAESKSGKPSRWGANYYFSSWVWIGFLSAELGRLL